MNWNKMDPGFSQFVTEFGNQFAAHQIEGPRWKEICEWVWEQIQNA